MISMVIMMDADWCPTKVPQKKYELVVTIPKTKPNINFEILKQYCDKIAKWKTKPHWYFQDYSVEQQFQFIENSTKCRLGILS